MAALFMAVTRLVAVRVAGRGSLGNRGNASNGAGLIEPAPFQDAPVLAAVKDASRRCAVGLRPIPDRSCARCPVGDQAGTEKRLPSRTKKRIIVSGAMMSPTGPVHAASFNTLARAGSNSVRVRNIAQATASSRSATVRNARPCE